MVFHLGAFYVKRWYRGTRAVVRQQYGDDLPYADLIQQGRIALWQAILHYDPPRGSAFSTYAWCAIRRRIWSSVARAQRPRGYLLPTAPPDPLVQTETFGQQAAILPSPYGSSAGRVGKRPMA